LIFIIYYYFCGGENMNKLNKEKIMNMFENYFNDIMGKDRKNLFEMPQMIKSKVIDLGEKILQNWIDEKINNDNRENKITKSEDNDRKK